MAKGGLSVLNEQAPPADIQHYYGPRKQGVGIGRLPPQWTIEQHLILERVLTRVQWTRLTEHDQFLTGLHPKSQRPRYGLIPHMDSVWDVILEKVVEAGGCPKVSKGDLIGYWDREGRDRSLLDLRRLCLGHPDNALNVVPTRISVYQPKQGYLIFPASGVVLEKLQLPSEPWNQKKGKGGKKKV